MGSPYHPIEALTSDVNAALEGNTHARALLEEAVHRLPRQLRGGQHLWRAESGAVLGRFFETTVGSRFHAIRAVKGNSVMGHEAAVKAPLKVSWDQLIQPLDDVQVTAVDRLLRVLHTLNYFSVAGQRDLLFLNVHHRFLSAVTDNHGRAFRRVIESFGLSPEQFVIQVQGRSVADLHALGFASDNYRRNGFLTGLHAHDFVEAGSLIGQLRPDFLSLHLGRDWALSSLAGLSDAARQFHVRLIARNSVESDLFALEQSGIDWFVERLPSLDLH